MTFTSCLCLQTFGSFESKNWGRVFAKLKSWAHDLADK